MSTLLSTFYTKESIMFKTILSIITVSLVVLIGCGGSKSLNNGTALKKKTSYA